MASTAMAERIAAIKAYATEPEHYEAGWSVVVETMTDEDIAAKIKGARGEKGAIAKLQRDVDLWNEAMANTEPDTHEHDGDTEYDADPQEGEEFAEQDDGDPTHCPPADEPPVAEVAPVAGMKGHKPECKCVGCGIARKKASGEFKPSGAVAKVKASKPAAPRAAKTANSCHCGCGNSTGSTFAVGHDARFASMLKRAYLATNMTRDDAQAAADAVSAAFARKVRRMLTLADQEIAKAAKAEVAA